ncbi:hypothetical protein HYR69_07655 [Candidatus Sumerlaeota bacterium]|nr:hypothetical protein [Candidatus Sumerlaeota bacterium]MBI3735483.1 hypothetical protein [Candidatus Sumerlaeota bacterium]
MICNAKVENGIIRLPEGLNLPDGAEVQVSIPDANNGESFAERYAEFIGAADDLPSDLAENLDHYVHGQAKR